MKYLLPHKNCDYFPQVLAELNGIQDGDIFHSDHGLMHPVDVFMTTFNDVVESALRLAKSLNNIVAKRKIFEKIDNEETESIRAEILSFLFFSANFIESCQSIIKSLFKKGDTQSGKAEREFSKLTSDYRAHVSKIINYIKHRHRRVRILEACWSDQIILGYYIEGVVSENVIGPDPDVHKNSNCGISLNRDIPYHIVNLYFVSSCLDTVMKKYIKLTSLPFQNLDGGKLIALFREIDAIPKNFFPDEINKPFPCISIQGNSLSEVCLEYPGRNKVANRKPHDMDITVTSNMGIRSRTLKLPYFSYDV